MQVTENDIIFIFLSRAFKQLRPALIMELNKMTPMRLTPMLWELWETLSYGRRLSGESGCSEGDGEKQRTGAIDKLLIDQQGAEMSRGVEPAVVKDKVFSRVMEKGHASERSSENVKKGDTRDLGGAATSRSFRTERAIGMNR